MACLDTSALLDLSGRSGAAAKRRARLKLESLADAGEDLVTTRFTVAELWVGVVRARVPADEQKKVEALLAPLDVLDFDQKAAIVFGHIVGDLQRRGTTVGDMDSLIAAVCIVHGHSIVTRNVRHFTAIAELGVESY